MAGITFSMKNMYGASIGPTCCTPITAIRDCGLNCIPAIRDKVRLTIGDAMSSVYQGGRASVRASLVSECAHCRRGSRAVDSTALQMLDRKRVEAGLATLDAAGRTPHYIATAADSAHRLGTTIRSASV